MLVLSRRVGERIVIDHGTVQVLILGVDQNRVRVGIDAPPQIQVDRAEIATFRDQKGESDE